MSTSYPTALDTLTNPTSSDTLDNPSHSDQHADLNDAVEAIEAELGVSPSGSYATVVARLDALPMGLLDSITRTSDQASIGATETDLTGLSVTVNVPNATRSIKISAGGAFLATASERAELRIKENATVFQSGRVLVDTGLAQSIHLEVTLNPTAGSHTYKLAAISATGSGFLTLKASSTSPAYLIVEDIGSTT